MSLENEQNELEKLRSSSLEQQSSYIYKPTKRSSPHAQKSNKKRKLSRSKVTEDFFPFVPLLGGQENEAAVELRYRTFRDFWSNQERKVQAILSDVHSKVLTNITYFVENISFEKYNGRIPTGVITLGSNISSIGRLFHRLQDQMQSKRRVRVVVLDSGDATNLKTVLKALIRATIKGPGEDANTQDISTDRLGPKLLPYDLDLLYEYAQRNGIDKIVIAVKDTESFDQRLLSDLIALLGSWLDRLHFVLLFGVVTSVELFEGRLPRSTVNLLQGQRFEVQDSENSVDRVFMELQNQDDGVLWLGHGISKLITQLSRDRFQSPERFSASIKYACMSHFFANPLSVLLADAIPREVQRQPHLCEAIRNLPSFQRHVEDLLEDKDTTGSSRLLNDDGYLMAEAQTHVALGQKAMKLIFETVCWISDVVGLLKASKGFNTTDLAIQALQGELLESKVIGDMLAAIKKMPSDSLNDLLGTVPDNVTEIVTFRDELDKLINKKQGDGPLRSQYDESHTTHKTTVVGQMVRLTKGRAKLSQDDSEYTSFVNRLHDAVVDYLSDVLIQPDDLFMNEAFVNDHKSPIKDTFSPRGRFAIERSLSAPSDYLGSKSDEDTALSPTEPAVAILYQLYMESGAFVNIYDLWRAFYMIIGGEDGENCEERLALALFYRALSELKMMGMVKPTRKKLDHLAKSTWTGL